MAIRRGMIARLTAIGAVVGTAVVIGAAPLVTLAQSQPPAETPKRQPRQPRQPNPTTPLPGVIFGLLVAACTWWFGTRDRFLLFVAFAFTVLAWILAYDSTAVVYGQLALYKKPPAASTSAGPASGAEKQDSDAPARSDASTDGDKADSEDTPSEKLYLPFLSAMSGIVGGLVGGFVTVFGVSIASPRVRRFDFWTITILLAGVLGTLMELVRIERHLGFLLLFAIWQAAVIALIARGLAFGDDSAAAAD